MLRDSVLQKQEEIDERKHEIVVHGLPSFCPSEEKVGIGDPTNKETGVRANIMSSTFKQLLLEAWLMKGKLSFNESPARGVESWGIQGVVLKGDWITVGAIITSKQSFAAQS